MTFPLLALIGVAAAQVDQDAATWTSLGLQVGLHEGGDTGPRLWADLHARRTGANFTGIVRPAVGWDVAKDVAVFAGYAWIPQEGASTDHQLLNEHRIWEQLLVSRAVGKVAVGLRPRLEQRFLQEQDEVGHRLRLWARVGVPLEGKLSLAVSDEVFLGLVDTAWAPGGFDQNRAFVGPALPVADHGRVEFGYMNTFVSRETGDTALHIVSANLYLNL